MHLGTLHHDGRDRVMVRKSGTEAVDLSHLFANMVEMIEAGDAALAAARAALEGGGETVSLTDCAFRCPLRPVQYRDCLVFEDHLIGSFAQAERMTGRAFAIPPVWYDQPIYYKGNRMSFIGHGEDVIWPGYAAHLDVELELAIVIGKTGTSVSRADAPRHIWGYTILNDVSARDAQMVEMPGQLGPAKGKDFDTGNILGPWIVTADEIAHPAALEMQLHVNGERWGGGNSARMHHDFARIIEHISQSETLYPGEVIGSGTVGTGCGLELGRRLEPGDRFDLTIEKIGTLSNRIVRA
ncbi:MAG: fumarylacetoacetate hydrolase family protein [Rhodobacteraceae bacterium]|nr:fumarylacetoacetate hydrolase family protein [Paracoccaceae bacterium]